MIEGNWATAPGRPLKWEIRFTMQRDGKEAVGTTIAFDYIVHWTRLAAGRRARLVEVNPDHQFLKALGAEWIKAPAASALSRIVDQLTSRALS